ncbi:MAG: LysR family transcriptional regulator, partial [Rhodospirillales bacterium]|nr:LysR family transcriptional regulator [Rhodospirillales bacterium]
MNLTFKQLRYATAAGRLGSVAAAAAEIKISQSSITAAIDSIEAELGVDLFIRLPAKGIRPTPAGREALTMMQGMLNHVARFESELESLGGSPRGFLRLGCYVTAAPYVLPLTLRAFSHRYPQARVDLREGDMMAITDLLVAGEVDLAMTYRDVVTTEL